MIQLHNCIGISNQKLPGHCRQRDAPSRSHGSGIIASVTWHRRLSSQCHLSMHCHCHTGYCALFAYSHILVCYIMATISVIWHGCIWDILQEDYAQNDHGFCHLIDHILYTKSIVYFCAYSHREWESEIHFDECDKICVCNIIICCYLQHFLGWSSD